jgi:hypothetical protein
MEVAQPSKRWFPTSKLHGTTPPPKKKHNFYFSLHSHYSWFLIKIRCHIIWQISFGIHFVTKFTYTLGVSFQIKAYFGISSRNTCAVCKVRGLILLLQVGTLWKCGDSLFFEVPPLARNALLTALHPLLENVLQTVDHFEISCLGAPFSWLEKPRNCMRQDLN